MVIAIVQALDSTVRNDPPRYVVGMRVQATDGVDVISAFFSVDIAPGTNRSHFNDDIMQAAIDRIHSDRPSWVVDMKDVYFQPFDNG